MGVGVDVDVGVERGLLGKGLAIIHHGRNTRDAFSVRSQFQPQHTLRLQLVKPVRGGEHEHEHTCLLVWEQRR